MRPSSALYIGVVMGIILMGCMPESERPAPPAEASSPLRIHFNQHPEAAHYGTVEVEGLDAGVLRRLKEATLTSEEWSAFFAVYTSEAWAAGSSMPPVLGAYSVEPPVIRFTPRFPLVAGLSYAVHFDGAMLHARWPVADAAWAPSIDSTFILPQGAASAPTVVTEVYPTTDTLPMNQLKFYLHFSAPMERGRAYAHLQLIDQQSGARVEAPFVEIEPELWDPEQRRLTLLFDPGRIKRDVGPNRERGPPLQAGHAYRLVVDRRWRDAMGRPLQEDFVKAFQVVEADRLMPDPDDWQWITPTAETVDPLVLNFPEPLDHALLQRLFTVHDGAGVRLEGSVALDFKETQWSFTPAVPWEAGAYALHVETILEDLAGNTLRSLFDVDLAEAPASEVREAETIRVLPFVVKTPEAL